MKGFKERVIQEKSDLDEKIGKLQVFINGDVFLGLPLDERTLLNQQLSLMKDLSRVLGERINNSIDTAEIFI